MKVFRFETDDLKYGEDILLIAADDIEQAKEFLPTHRGLVYDGEQFQGLSWHGAAGILEQFYWEE